MIKSTRGITLIDLLILVAFVSILAAIFLPQLAVFAVRIQNTAAVSDLQNARQAQETFHATWGKYGVSSIGPLPGSGHAGSGFIIMGPGAPGNPPILSMVDETGTQRGILIQLSNDVSFGAQTNVGAYDMLYSISYTMVAKHNNGDTTFGVDSDSRAIFRNTVIGAPNQTTYMLQSADMPFSTPAIMDFSAAMNWIVM